MLKKWFEFIIMVGLLTCAGMLFAIIPSRGDRAEWFHSIACEPCKRMEPIVAEMIEDGYAINGTLVCDDWPAGIDAVPTTVIYRGDREIKRLVGFQTRKELELYLEKASQK